MGRFDNIKATIDANIRQNGNQEITGQVLNDVLNGMMDSTDSVMTSELAKKASVEDLNSKASTIYVDEAIASAITTTLNTEV